MSSWSDTYNQLHYGGAEPWDDLKTCRTILMKPFNGAPNLRPEIRIKTFRQSLAKISWKSSLRTLAEWHISCSMDSMTCRASLIWRAESSAIIRVSTVNLVDSDIQNVNVRTTTTYFKFSIIDWGLFVEKSGLYPQRGYKNRSIALLICFWVYCGTPSLFEWHQKRTDIYKDRRTYLNTPRENWQLSISRSRKKPCFARKSMASR